MFVVYTENGQVAIKIKVLGIQHTYSQTSVQPVSAKTNYGFSQVDVMKSIKIT